MATVNIRFRQSSAKGVTSFTRRLGEMLGLESKILSLMRGKCFRHAWRRAPRLRHDKDAIPASPNKMDDDHSQCPDAKCRAHGWIMQNILFKRLTHIPIY